MEPTGKSRWSFILPYSPSSMGKLLHCLATIPMLPGTDPGRHCSRWTGRRRNDLQDDALPFDAELIPRSIAALLGGPQEKMAHVQYLTAMSAQTTDEGLKALLQVIQLGLFGSDLSQLGQNLSGVYREAWEAIVMGVETGGVDPRLFEMIVQNTLAVLGPAADQKGEWRDELMQIRVKQWRETHRS